MLKRIVTVLVLASIVPVGARAEEKKQALVPGSTVTATPGRQYGAGGLHRLVFGGHYRGLWTTPLKVEVLDLATFGGGLTPVKRGGGRQSQTLRFNGGDGRQYAFRSIDKDPSAVLSEAYRKTFVAGILRDQVSSQHPVAPLVAAPLLEAAGVLHATPRLAVLPDDPRLGEFRAQFGGMFGMIEERPDDASEENPGFYGATDVVSSDTLFKRLEKGANHRIDARTYLKARLVDIYLGDWDRHADQWRWASFDEGGLHIWRPIPKDRDQAFSRFDGLLNWYVAFYQPTIVSFREKYPRIFRMVFSGRNLDRRLLAELDWPQWEEVTAELTSRLTDAAIDGAVKQLPPEYVQRSGPELARVLKKRRDRLARAARDFYAILVTEVDVHATDDPDIAVVDRKQDGKMEVLLYAGTSGGGEPTGEPFFRRVFDSRKTREVRLYLHGGDDRLITRGEKQVGIKVRAIGGKGDDDLRAAAVGGNLRCYDGRREVMGSADMADCRELPSRPPAQKEQRIPLVESLPAPARDWGTQTAPRVTASYNPDIGLYLDGGVVHTRYGFRQEPYRQRHTLHGGYATGAMGARVEYAGDFRMLGRRTRFETFARASNIEIIRFSGYGNETPAPSGDRQKVTQKQLLLEPSLVLHPSQNIELSLGPRLQLTDADPDPGTVLAEVRPEGIDRFDELGARADLTFDTRNRPVHATRGVFFDVGASAYPAVLSVKKAFGEVHGQAATYLTAGGYLEPTLAFRVGGKKVWGAFPFHEAATVGGKDTLRGFLEQRFAGDACVYGNAELRLFLTRFSVLSPGDMGIFFVGDAGRVYLEGEDSNKWHAGFGGGIWLAFVERRNTVSVAVVRSAEKTGVYARLGFGF
jgi:hypothetical protein